MVWLFGRTLRKCEPRERVRTYTLLALEILIFSIQSLRLCRDTLGFLFWGRNANQGVFTPNCNSGSLMVITVGATAVVTLCECDLLSTAREDCSIML